MDIADGSNPFRHAIELQELPLERREYRKVSQARSLVTLFEREVTAYHALYDRGRSIEWSMASDVRQSSVHFDQLVVPWRNDGLRKRQTSSSRRVSMRPIVRSLIRSDSAAKASGRRKLLGSWA